MKAFISVSAFVASAIAGPCDIYDAGGTPCVAAHSMVRALYSNYNGPLYSLQRTSDQAVQEIKPVVAGGFADSAAHDSFCGRWHAAKKCIVLRIFDQSPRGNHLDTAPGGGIAKDPDKGVFASKHKLKVGNHRVYGAFFEQGMGYRNDNTSGVATGEEPESIYMVANGKHTNVGCCFDYGNAETDNLDDGEGTMEALYFGGGDGWSGRGSGDGPWVMVDIENALSAGGNVKDENNPSLKHEYVTAMMKGKQGAYALKGGNAQSGNVQTFYEGPRPKGWEIMKKQGAIVLGIGGDNSNWAVGTFYEGAMTAGYATDATDDAVQADIVSAGYGRKSDVDMYV